jgi:flagellar protein FlgJ
MIHILSAAVGPGRPNKPSDVKAVQYLLNRCLYLLVPKPMLRETGAYDAETASAIRLFQQRVLHMPIADGVVSTTSLTWSQLHAIGDRAWPSNVATFVAATLPAAKLVKATWRVPVAALIAQSAQETGWGSRVVANAYFGIKGRAPDGAAAKIATHEVVAGAKVAEVDEFRAYKDFAEAADDYGRFLNENRRYAGALAVADDPLKFVAEIAAAGYATDPKYGSNLKSIILVNGLLRFDA